MEEDHESVLQDEQSERFLQFYNSQSFEMMYDTLMRSEKTGKRREKKRNRRAMRRVKVRKREKELPSLVDDVQYVNQMAKEKDGLPSPNEFEGGPMTREEKQENEEPPPLVGDDVKEWQTEKQENEKLPSLVDEHGKGARQTEEDNLPPLVDHDLEGKRQGRRSRRKKKEKKEEKEEKQELPSLVDKHGEGTQQTEKDTELDADDDTIKRLEELGEESFRFWYVAAEKAQPWLAQQRRRCANILAIPDSGGLGQIDLLVQKNLVPTLKRSLLEEYMSSIQVSVWVEKHQFCLLAAGPGIESEELACLAFLESLSEHETPPNTEKVRGLIALFNSLIQVLRVKLRKKK